MNKLKEAEENFNLSIKNRLEINDAYGLPLAYFEYSRLLVQLGRLEEAKSNLIKASQYNAKGKLYDDIYILLNQVKKELPPED